MDSRCWVAVIDDDVSVRRSLTRVLSAYGVGVGTYCSAEEYLRRPTADPPQCVVVDVQLAGGMTGLELLDRLASDAAGPGIILMTGMEIPEALMALHGDRASWLRKPFEAVRLMGLVRMHLPQQDGPGGVAIST